MDLYVDVRERPQTSILVRRRPRTAQLNFVSNAAEGSPATVPRHHVSASRAVRLDRPRALRRSADYWALGRISGITAPPTLSSV